MTAYTYLNKATKHNIMSMEEIAVCENAENPKEAIKRLVEEAAARRKAARMEEEDYA